VSLPLCMAILALALAGCGGGKAATATNADTHRKPVTKVAGGKLSPAAETAASAVQEPHAVVVRVGSSRLSQSMLQHLVGAEVATEPPSAQVALVPPAFSACVAKLNATDTATFESAGGSPAEHMQACKARYEELRSEALKQWIVGEWLVHGAAEAGVGVSDRDVLAAYKREVLESSPSVASFEKSLVGSGRSKQDVMRRVRTTLASERIRAKMQADAKVTPADVHAYYLAHKSQFAIPQSRDLKILRTKTEAEAVRAKREIAHGRSFASLAKAATLQQPIFSHDGLVRGLKPGVYHETPINQGIFRAKPNVLSGPVHLPIGWYVFEVKRIHWGRQQSFGEVASTIERTLPDSREKQALARFIKRWRAKWRSRTSCSPGYVVEKCREFKLPDRRSELAEDPYTLA
jgi:foldase protein PrsA